MNELINTFFTVFSSLNVTSKITVILSIIFVLTLVFIFVIYPVAWYIFHAIKYIVNSIIKITKKGVKHHA